MQICHNCEDAASSKQETNQKPLTCNIPPAASTEDESLATIFPFKLEEITSVPLFSRATLDTKPITMMYTNAKVDDWTIQELQLSQNGRHTCILAMYSHFKTINTPAPLIKFEEEEKKPIWEAYQENKEKNIPKEPSSMLGLMTAKGRKKKKTYLEKLNSQKTQPKDGQAHTPFASHYYSHHLFHLNAKTVKRNFFPWKHGSYQMKTTGREHIITANHAITNAIDIQSTKTSETTNHLLNEEMWNDISGQGKTCNTSCQYTILISNWVSHDMPITTIWHRVINQLDGYPHDEDEIWQMVNAKVQRATPSEILEVKNNLSEQVDIIFILNSDVFLNIETNSEDFHEHYQNLALTREEQKEHLCDLIYNPPICMIYTISEEEEPINSCTSELESIFNPDSNSNNDDDENNGSSSIQNSNNNDNNSNADSNSNSNYKQYITLPNLTKKQELK
ncbi:hypothetical protein G9A89_011120 [Geosiphon pyriformis]|nr:hypothetical protein G9A89_011120 [Geosiphon pyriformis]